MKKFRQEKLTPGDISTVVEMVGEFSPVHDLLPFFLTPQSEDKHGEGNLLPYHFAYTWKQYRAIVSGSHSWLTDKRALEEWEQVLLDIYRL